MMDDNIVLKPILNATLSLMSTVMLIVINYTNNRKHAIFILGNHFFGAFKLFLILMANVIINYKHYC
jgi:hypothetical protein